MTQGRTGVVAAASAAVLFGASNVATVFLLEAFTPIGGALWRALVAAVLLLGLIGLARIRPAAVASTPPSHSGRSRALRALVIGLCGGPLFLAGLNLAVAGVGPTVTAFVSGLYAVFAAVLAPFVLGEALRARVILGLMCALAGCVLLSNLEPDSRFTAGLVAALVAAGVYAWYLVLGRRWSSEYQLSPQVLTGSTIGATIIALAVWLGLIAPADVLSGPVTPGAVGGLAFMAMTLAIGQTLVMASVRRITAARTAAFLLLNPITAAILAALIFSERLSTIQMVGAALVLVGMAVTVGLDRIITTSRRREGGSEPSPS